MWRYTDNTFRQTPPATVEQDGYIIPFADLTREQLDALGYNEAVSVKREPFTTYETRWVKDDDLIYREEVIAATVDGVAKTEAAARKVRQERNTRLAASDWTQLADSTLDAEAMILWQSYRQALRDVPQQTGFPYDIAWPEPPRME